MPYLQLGDVYLRRDDSEKVPDFLPGAGVQFSQGLTNRLDIGGKVDVSSFVAAQAKYQLLGTRTSRFALSAGAEAGIMVVPLLAGLVPYYFSLPTWLSYHPNERLAFYLSPSYTFMGRYVGANTNGNGREAFWHTRERSGFSYGFSAGKKNKLFLEMGNYHYRLHLPTHLAAGYTFFFR